MAVDETLYITTNEAALAVVATAMKKARLLLDTLIINSFVGGMLFTAGGMLHVFAQSNLVGMIESNNPGMVSLIQGLLYPIGLFYVVILGVDLFNSNILFFSVALARGAVSVLDLVISWVVSFAFNLVGNIFVCYIVCHFSHVSANPNFVTGSKLLVIEKVSFTFVETLIKGMAGNFFVCLAIYLQLMVKPLHVKFFALALPIFTFVTMGFTHSVADMFILTIGLINGAEVSVGKVVWKVFLPGAIGNIIGGAFFGLLIPYYLHIIVVEKDIHLLKLPRYEYRDEQPELNQDSRVVRVATRNNDDVAENDNENDDFEQDNYSKTNIHEKIHVDGNENLMKYTMSESLQGTTADSSQGTTTPYAPVQLTRDESFSNMSIASRYSTFSNRRPERVNQLRSPKNVFPVYGMGPPLKREKSIASGSVTDETHKQHTVSDEPMDPMEYDNKYLENTSQKSAEFIGEKLKKMMTRRTPSLGGSTDLENQKSENLKSRRFSSASVISSFKRDRGLSFRQRRESMRNDLGELERRLVKAGISPKIANAANDISGISPLPTSRTPPPPQPTAAALPLPRSPQTTLHVDQDEQ